MNGNKEYWQNRTIARLISSEQKGLKSLATILSIYDEAERNIQNQIQNLYDNYAKKGILEKADLDKALSPTERIKFLRKVDQKARLLGLDPDKVYDDRYLGRLTRLEALKEQIRIETMALAPQEVNISQQTYANIVGSGYVEMQNDLSTIGANPAFSKLNKDIVDEILRNQWYGGNYSSRIWTNTDILAQRLPIVLGAALSSGQSYQTTARLLREEFDVSQYNASRLVRTESNFFHNQSELQTYVDDGIYEYDYDAVMDGKTSKICRGLNNKRFKVKDAVVGKNYPPMHGHCRSTTAPVFNGDEERVGTRAERTERLNIGPTNNQIRRKFINKMKDDIQIKSPSPVESLAKRYSGNELIDKLGALVKKTPKDDPTRAAIVKAAELYGWRNA